MPIIQEYQMRQMPAYDARIVLVTVSLMRHLMVGVFTQNTALHVEFRAVVGKQKP